MMSSIYLYVHSGFAIPTKVISLRSRGNIPLKGHRFYRVQTTGRLHSFYPSTYPSHKNIYRIHNITHTYVGYTKMLCSFITGKKIFQFYV